MAYMKPGKLLARQARDLARFVKMLNGKRNVGFLHKRASKCET